MPVNAVPTKERIILGIDPGTTIMGYGVLRIIGNNPQLLTMGVLQLGKMGDHYLKLRRIFERTLGLIEQYHPDEMAIEAPFFGKNVQSMLKLGRAQGIAMAAALYRDIPITEYAPLKIKLAITGNGKAAKEQVADMLRRILHIPEENMLPQLDATDGLAAALCHFYQTNRPSLEKPYKSWKDFINQHPSRLSRETSPRKTYVRHKKSPDAEEE
ncbi:MAG: crossover junction endodeoxyribonuclease RuvC [Porphyromonadaceae bacterium]|nr:crossover junction endodeoxyribonuclease RuvC [Porphyromonadaceae bacterium]